MPGPPGHLLPLDEPLADHLADGRLARPPPRRTTRPMEVFARMLKQVSHPPTSIH